MDGKDSSSALTSDRVSSSSSPLKKITMIHHLKDSKVIFPCIFSFQKVQYKKKHFKEPKIKHSNFKICWEYLSFEKEIFLIVLSVLPGDSPFKNTIEHKKFS